MPTIDEVSKLYQQIDLVQIAKDLVIANQDSILDINRVQLMFGFDSNGNYITPEYYYASYARYKLERGTKAPYRTPDLLDTGKFYKSLKFDKDFRVISTGVDYANDLHAKYGDDIYGFNDKNLSLYRVKYREELKKRLGLGL